MPNRAAVLVLAPVAFVATQVWAERSAEELQVAVLVAAARVRLGVHTRFAETGTDLPKPGELPAQDEHDGMHGAHTYCYSYRTKGGPAALEFFDSAFGLHTARLLRALGEAHRTCTSQGAAMVAQPANSQSRQGAGDPVIPTGC